MYEQLAEGCYATVYTHESDITYCANTTSRTKVVGYRSLVHIIAA